MLTKMEARNSQGDLLSLELGVMDDGYVLSDIKGLGPVKATFSSSTFAQVDGARFGAARRETRNLVITIDLEPDYITTSAQDLRDNLYQFFMTKSLVYIRLYNSSGLVVDCSGRVEDCDTPLFTDKPKVDISVICFDPDFIGLTEVTTSGNTVSDETTTLYSYPGTSDVGTELVLTLDRSLGEFTVYHTAPDGTTRQLDFTASMLNGDIVTINTVRGSKKAVISRAGVITSYLYGVSPQSYWWQFSRGDNNIRVYAEGAAIPYTITYTPRYGGL